MPLWLKEKTCQPERVIAQIKRNHDGKVLGVVHAQEVGAHVCVALHSLQSIVCSLAHALHSSWDLARDDFVFIFQKGKLEFEESK